MKDFGQIKTDCRHFRGYIPCGPHKQHGVHCQDCKWYQPVAERVLIIKLDSIGDVLRTTCIIPKIKELFPSSHITWIVKPKSIELLSSNPDIDDVWNYNDTATFNRLHVQRWDYVYSLDNTQSGAALASVARAKVKRGYILSRQGVITPTNDAALKWIRMSISDVVKKRNLQSYQEIMYEICGFSSPISKPVICLPKDCLEWADKFVGELCNKEIPKVPIIGINTGSGNRWPMKMLDVQQIIKVVSLLLTDNSNWHILILGGPNEINKNRQIIKGIRSRNVYSVGCDYSLLRFSAIINKCDVILCGDTLALHIATALDVPVVALFGPTSHVEIYDYDNLIQKIVGQLDCLCCYSRCDKNENCMSVISPEEIVNKIKQQINYSLNY